LESIRPDSEGAEELIMETVPVLIGGLMICILMSLFSASVGQQTLNNRLKDDCLIKREIVLAADDKLYKFKCEFAGESK
jgi:hypothetical protein